MFNPIVNTDYLLEVLFPHKLFPRTDKIQGIDYCKLLGLNLNDVQPDETVNALINPAAGPTQVVSAHRLELPAGVEVVWTVCQNSIKASFQRKDNTALIDHIKDFAVSGFPDCRVEVDTTN